MTWARKPRTPPEKFRIIRDTREQRDKGWNFRASGNCYGMEIKKLDVGDYTVEGMEKILMVERKTLGDLWGTLGRQENYERFLREMERAKDHKLKYLVIEATLEQVDGGTRFSKVSPANIHAKLFSLQVKHNVHVIFAGDQDTARKWVRSLFDKLSKYKKEGLFG